MFRILSGVLPGALVFMIAAGAAAQVVPQIEAPDPVLPAPVLPDAVSTAVASPASAVSASQALSLEELQEESGRQGIQIYAGANQNLSAVNSGNSIHADQVGSGNITLSEGAFAGFSGIGNFVVNSGHNNNLQGSLSIILVTPQ
ncbi:hypothetical protein [Brevundimonas pondensis]|uniref:Uncharacterized protein n=1 Tax=Brevundimonas pondensis TaxID=2774189 RepID=A0ABX7SKC9_9CAUL|nr:hypothetical protein [Brevundimonas pondensis]QTC88147.1 hypothetical protein IFE19_01690 [Brevundimonas pondensis]